MFNVGLSKAKYFFFIKFLDIIGLQKIGSTFNRGLFMRGRPIEDCHCSGRPTEDYHCSGQPIEDLLLVILKHNVGIFMQF